MNSAYIQVPNRTNEWVQEQVPIWMRLYLVIGQGLFLPLLVLGKKKKNNDNNNNNRENSLDM